MARIHAPTSSVVATADSRPSTIWRRAFGEMFHERRCADDADDRLVTGAKTGTDDVAIVSSGASKSAAGACRQNATRGRLTTRGALRYACGRGSGRSITTGRDACAMIESQELDAISFSMP